MTTATRTSPDTSYRRSADIATSTFDPASRTVDVIWTTGATVPRSDLFLGRYDETLITSPDAVRLDRLNSGGPVLDCHNQFEIGAVLGSIVPGSVRLSNGTGTATVHFADTPDVADSVAKIQAGHVRTLSVGYLVHEWTRLEGDRNQPDEWQATDWEPYEISFVPVPADPGCTVRSWSNDMTRIIEGGRRSAAPAATLGAPAIHHRATFTGYGSDHSVAPTPTIAARATTTPAGVGMTASAATMPGSAVAAISGRIAPAGGRDRMP